MNQRAVEAVYSATYVEDYIETVDNLPDEIQRQLTRMRELDISSHSHIGEVKRCMASLLGMNAQGARNEEDEKTYNSIKTKIQHLLMSVQDIGDEKIQIGQHIQDYAENRLRQLELDKKTLDQANRSGEAHSHDSVTQHHSVVRENKPEGAAESRGLKRARRARLDPSMSINGPSPAKAASNAHRERENTEKPEKEKRVDVQQNSVAAPVPASTPASTAASTSVVSAPATVSTPTAAPPAVVAAAASTSTPASTKPTRTPSAVATSTRRDSEASTSGSAATSYTQKKNSIDSSSGNSNSEPAERKSETVTTRTPKKQYQTKQKATEKKAATATKKKRTRQMEIDDSPPSNLPLDPDEPTYCLCDQVSYGDMIGCDNDLCPLEWFHFNCVNLSMKPKGKWFCPKCRGDRQNVMKPKAVFMKELEKYNREKEEKS